MSTQIVSSRNRGLAKAGLGVLPALITDAGENASRRFVEFFTANIRNKNTRMAYVRALGPFIAWCEGRGLALGEIQPVHVAAYVEQHPGWWFSQRQAGRLPINEVGVYRIESHGLCCKEMI